jgi:hypothetical protein
MDIVGKTWCHYLGCHRISPKFWGKAQYKIRTFQLWQILRSLEIA